jgi:ribosomal protein S20
MREGGHWDCLQIDTAVEEGALHRNTGARKKAEEARIASGSVAA